MDLSLESRSDCSDDYLSEDDLRDSDELDLKCDKPSKASSSKHLHSILSYLQNDSMDKYNGEFTGFTAPLLPVNQNLKNLESKMKLAQIRAPKFEKKERTGPYKPGRIMSVFQD